MAGQRTVTDMLGRSLALPLLPQRIVSLVPSQTELLFDLGLREEVVGITKFCVHPPEWFRSKARVGGTKAVHTKKVAALGPDLILANKEENVREQIELLSTVAPVWVSDIGTMPDALRMIREVGSLTGKPDAAQRLAADIHGGFETLKKGEGRRVAYCIWREPWMWAGGDTFIHDVLQRMGWHNVLAGIPRYPAVSLEALRDFCPDLVLLSSEPYPFKAKHLAEVGAALPAAEVLLVDGEMFSWYGSRLAKVVPYLQSLLSAVP